MSAERASVLERFAARITTLAEQLLPDAYVFALVATSLVFLLGLALGAAPLALVESWGQGFWELLGFSMQTVLMIVAGHIVANAPGTRRGIDWLAGRARSPRGAVAFVAAISLVTSWFNWGFGLITSAVLVRAIARRHPGVDYRALCAASLLGIGSVWAQGLSGSAALQMATPGAISPVLRAIVAEGGLLPDGLIGLRHTILLPQSFLSVAIELVIVTGLMWLIAPTTHARDAASLGISLSEPEPEPDPDSAPRAGFALGPSLDHSRLVTLPVAALALVHVAWSLRTGFTALSLGTINLFLLTLGMLLHGSPRRLLAAVQNAVPSTAGVVLQFPFYAGIAAMISASHLNEAIAGLFVRVATHDTFPPLMAAYSTLLGLFVPSGGGKWIIEAPYVLRAAHTLKVHLGWTVACYDLGEALANLVQPFWMLPVLGMFRLRARDVMGYTFVVFLVLFPLVLGLTWALGRGLPYPL